MPQTTSSRRRRLPMAAAVLLVVLVSVTLAACGGATTSTPSTSTAARSATATPSTTAKTRGAIGGRFTALRACLQKNGIALPKFTPGQRPAPGTRRSFLPKGVSKAQYEAAIKKCGGPAVLGGTRNRFNTPAFKQALAKFSACMRENGVNIPKANTSGTGPIFNSKHLNTSSPTFRAAETKCRGDLSGALRGAPGAHTAPGSPPPAG